MMITLCKIASIYFIKIILSSVNYNKRLVTTFKNYFFIETNMIIPTLGKYF